MSEVIISGYAVCLQQLQLLHFHFVYFFRSYNKTIIIELQMLKRHAKCMFSNNGPFLTAFGFVAIAPTRFHSIRISFLRQAFFYLIPLSIFIAIE